MTRPGYPQSTADIESAIAMARREFAINARANYSRGVARAIVRDALTARGFTDARIRDRIMDHAESIA